MCLIITGKSSAIRSTLINTNGMLHDIFSSNPDGIGIMYATTKGLKVIKSLPKHYGEARNFIEKLPQDDRELAIHFRWTTHGNTDMTNCHPYDIIPGYVAMMHNGVLHTGNTADKTKSDTWHFIKDFMASPVSHYPELVHDQSYLDMLSELIGDNRFVFMDGDGRMSHVNYDQGIEHDGLWFSNTYAWTPSKLIPNYYKSTKLSSRYSSIGYDYDDDFEYGYSHGGSWMYEKAKPVTKGEVLPLPELDINSDSRIVLIDRALEEFNATLMMDLIDSSPEETLEILFETYEPMWRDTARSDFSDDDYDILNMIVCEDIASLLDIAHDARLASCICYYFDWVERELA